MAVLLTLSTLAGLTFGSPSNLELGLGYRSFSKRGSLNTLPNITSCAALESFYSCENTTEIVNTCCSPTPGGLVLHTQFWSTFTGLEEEGQLLPEGSWTIHGLWPDNCDGSYEQYCDLTRQFDPIPDPANFTRNGEVVIVPPYKGKSVAGILEKFNRPGLLKYMENFWINQYFPNWYLWAHEFSKHATCTSTFDVSCYPSGAQENAEVVDFFEAAVRGFQMYPTYDILKAAGIVPSNTTKYPIEDIVKALRSQTGSTPHVGCSNNGTSLSEVWYYTHVWGTEQLGSYRAVETTFGHTCDKVNGVWYYERSKGSERKVEGVDFRH